MAHIKVTGYIDTEDLPFSNVDLSHPMGLTEDAYNAYVTGTQAFPPMDDIEFELQTADEETRVSYQTGAKKRGL